MVGMLTTEAGEEGRVKGKEKMGDGRGEVERKRKRGGGAGEAGRDWAERGKPPESPSIWSPDTNQAPSSSTMESYAAIKKHAVDLYLLAWRDVCQDVYLLAKPRRLLTKPCMQ